MAALDKLFTWSVSARSDFQAVTDDGQCSERFKLALATTIANGWDSNRDKPGWALAGLVSVLGQTDLAPATCLDLMWLSPGDIEAALKRFEGPEIGHNADGSVFMKAARGTIKMGPYRLRLLQKFLEFLVTCDDFAQSEAVVQLLDPLLTGGNVDLASKDLAKILYRYRTTHFDDGHASATFSVIRSFTLEAGDIIAEDSPLEFWTSDINSSFRTYSACFFAFRDYADALADAVQRAAMDRGMDASDPGLQGELAVEFKDPFLEEAEAADIAEDPEEQAPPATAEAALKSVAEGDLKILKKRDAQLLAPILQAGGFAEKLPRATIRLLAFHPIQSALSNSLRTGKALLPTEERVTCSEAQSYSDLAKDLEELESAMTDWLKIALALRAGENQENERAAELRAAGVTLLKQKRSKSFDRPADELAAGFAQIEAALIAVTMGLRGYGQALRSTLGSKAAEAFEADRARFAEVFADLYLEKEGA